MLIFLPTPTKLCIKGNACSAESVNGKKKKKTFSEVEVEVTLTHVYENNNIYY